MQNLHSLPLWARLLISDLQKEVVVLQDRLEAQGKALEVIKSKNWLQVDGPTEDEKVRKLFYLDKDRATPVVYLYPNDVLLVGRNKGTKNGKEKAQTKTSSNSNGQSVPNDENKDVRSSRSGHRIRKTLVKRVRVLR